jgi:hypothetical protein
MCMNTDSAIRLFFSLGKTLFVLHHQQLAGVYNRFNSCWSLYKDTVYRFKWKHCQHLISHAPKPQSASQEFDK